MIIVFSKDRAMQLRACLDGLLECCDDSEWLKVIILYKASDERHAKQYKKLAGEYRWFNFISEVNFRDQVISMIGGTTSDYIGFLVDDDMFCREFSYNVGKAILQTNSDILSICYRLGKNIAFSYMHDGPEVQPDFISMGGHLKFNWMYGKWAWGYPLELCHSLYRKKDILPLLNCLNYQNPNQLEAALNGQKNLFCHRPFVDCPSVSASFTTPINVVQNVFKNRGGHDTQYSVESLADMFDKGKRIEIEPFDNYTPKSVHEPQELKFI